MLRPHDTEIFDEPEDSDDPQLTEIVAYLDGELNEDACSRLERQLASSAPLRGYAESLDRTWQLLDSLGEATASDEFTQKTLASLNTISSDENQIATRSPLAWSKLRARIPATKILIWTATGFISCSIGLVVARISQTQRKDSEDTRILRQLELLEDYPRMYSIPGAEFLKQITAMENSAREKETLP